MTILGIGTYFADFFTENIKPKHGVILFKDSGQYVYMLLGGHETKKLKGVNGRYIAVALFRENIFIGFEEGCKLRKWYGCRRIHFFYINST